MRTGWHLLLKEVQIHLLLHRVFIRGLVVNKTNKRTYGSSGGVFFCFDVMDITGTVRAKAFENQCDRIFPLVNVGEVSCSVKQMEEMHENRFCRFRQ